MSKLLKNKLLSALALGIVILIISSLVPRHLGRTFNCYEYRGQTNVEVKREQYGFPLILAKRSMSSTSCETFNRGYGDKGPSIIPNYVVFNPDEHHEILDSGYFIMANMVGDFAFWLILSYLAITFIKNKKNAG